MNAQLKQNPGIEHIDIDLTETHAWIQYLQLLQSHKVSIVLDNGVVITNPEFYHNRKEETISFTLDCVHIILGMGEKNSCTFRDGSKKYMIVPMSNERVPENLRGDFQTTSPILDVNGKDHGKTFRFLWYNKQRKTGLCYMPSGYIFMLTDAQHSQPDFALGTTEDGKRIIGTKKK